MDEKFKNFTTGYYQTKITSPKVPELRKSEGDAGLEKISVNQRALIRAWDFANFIKNNLKVVEGARRMFNSEKLEFGHYKILNKKKVDPEIRSLAQNCQIYLSLRGIFREVSKAKTLVLLGGRKMKRVDPPIQPI